MAGFRLGIGPYREISAVCTHPDYLGRGYAAALIRHLIVLIVAKSWIPFLHVLKENTDAIKLYEKLGFRVRSEMQFNVIEKR
jgi:predicted GNAT family acetyltransferase